VCTGFLCTWRKVLEASALTGVALATILAVIVGYGGLEGGEGPVALPRGLVPRRNY